MTRYNDDPLKRRDDGYEMSNTQYIKWVGYTSGVDNVLNYIDSIQAYSKLVSELRWAINERII
jgi:hypothetical protein